MVLGLALLFFRLPTLFELPAVDQALSSYIGQKMQEGQLLYRDLWEHRPPGIYFLYNWIPWGGNNRHWLIPLMDMLYVWLTLGALWLLAKSFWGSRSALGAAFIFTLFSLSPAFQGSWSRNQTEVLMNLPLLLGLYGATRAHQQQKNWPWFFTGIALGIAFIFKFTALFLALPLIPLLWASPPTIAAANSFRLKRFFFLILGWMIPLAATLLYFYVKGVLPEAYQAVVVFNAVYSGLREELKSAPSILLYWYKGQLLLIAAVFILALLVWWREKFYLSLRGQILTLWILGGVISIFLQGKYFEPHFISLIPPFSLLAGYSWEWIKTKTPDRKSAALSLLVIALLAGATGDVFRDYFHAYKPNLPFLFKKVSYEQALRSLPANANKLEFLDLGKFIAQNSERKDYIYVWGWASEIYYYAGRPAPNRFIMHYYLLDAENPLAAKFPGIKARRQELLDNLKTKPVKFFLVGLQDTSMFEYKAPLTQLRAFPELNQWLGDNYFLVAENNHYLIFQKKPKGSNQ